jgi:glucose-6-phosphate isomerase
LATTRRGVRGGAARRHVAGEKINVAEGCAAVHVALRVRRSVRIEVDGTGVVRLVRLVLDAMAEFIGSLRDGRFVGHSGTPVRNVRISASVDRF